MSGTYAVKHVLDAPTAAKGAALAHVGAEVYNEVSLRGDTERSHLVATVYLDALQNDPEVGTAFWFAQRVGEDLGTFTNLQAYVLDSTFDHPTAATGRDLSTVALQALDRVPEACPKPAARLAAALLRGLKGLYDDGPSRQVVHEALQQIEGAMQISMAFGGGATEHPAARAVGREALLKLQATEDAATRLHRRVQEIAQQPVEPITGTDDSVVIAGVRVPKRSV